MKSQLKTVPIFLIAFLLFATSNDLLAQGRGGRQNVDPAERADTQLTAMTEALSLTEDQVTKIKPILMSNFEKQDAMRKEMRDGGGDRSTMRQKMQDLTEGQNEQLSVILSAEQMTKYKAWEKERRAARRGPRGPRPGNTGTR